MGLIGVVARKVLRAIRKRAGGKQYRGQQARANDVPCDVLFIGISPAPSCAEIVSCGHGRLPAIRHGGVDQDAATAWRPAPPRSSRRMPASWPEPGARKDAPGRSPRCLARDVRAAPAPACRCSSGPASQSDTMAMPAPATAACTRLCASSVTSGPLMRTDVTLSSSRRCQSGCEARREKPGQAWRARSAGWAGRPRLQIGGRGAQHAPRGREPARYQPAVGQCADADRHVEGLRHQIDIAVLEGRFHDHVGMGGQEGGQDGRDPHPPEGRGRGDAQRAALAAVAAVSCSISCKADGAPRMRR